MCRSIFIGHLMIALPPPLSCPAPVVDENCFNRISKQRTIIKILLFIGGDPFGRTMRRQREDSYYFYYYIGIISCVSRIFFFDWTSAIPRTFPRQKPLSVQRLSDASSIFLHSPLYYIYYVIIIFVYNIIECYYYDHRLVVIVIIYCVQTTVMRFIRVPKYVYLKCTWRIQKVLEKSRPSGVVVNRPVSGMHETIRDIYMHRVDVTILSF